MITEFSGEFRFLSNFYPSFVVFEGFMYPTVEHAYQAAKTESPSLRKEIRICGNAGIARRLGRGSPQRPEWENLKLPIMEDLLRSKFTLPHLQRKLLETSGQELIEGNWWGDTYWGVCGGVGQNNLGKLLMKIRDDLLPFPF